jgi:hypothetical protein
MEIKECWDKYLEDEVVKIQALECIILQVLHIAVRLAGIAVFVMLIIGGFRYLTSGGDPKAAESARKTITYAIFGLALILVSWFILRFIEEFTGVKVTEFTFPKAP